jgi:hypothetical protein
MDDSLKIIEIKVVPFEDKYRYTFKYTFNNEEKQINYTSDNCFESNYYFYFKALEYHNKNK